MFGYYDGYVLFDNPFSGALSYNSGLANTLVIDVDTVGIDLGIEFGIGVRFLVDQSDNIFSTTPTVSAGLSEELANLGINVDIFDLTIVDDFFATAPIQLIGFGTMLAFQIFG